MGWKGALVEGPLFAVSRLTAAWNPLPAAPREILVLRPNDLGDLLTTTPLFEALRQRFPQSRLVAGIGGWGRPILANNPNVDEILELSAPWNNKFVRDSSWSAVAGFLRNGEEVLAARRRGGFDIGIDVMGSHVGSMLMMRLGVRYRVGVRGYRGGWSACQRYINFSPAVHVARAALAQAELLGATRLPDVRPQLFLSPDEVAAAAQLWGPPRQHAIRLLVGCGAGLEEKNWPTEHLGQALSLVAQQFPRDGARPVEILVVGGPNERDRARTLVAQCGSAVRSVCGETSLRATFALTAAADVVLTQPSMLLHAAAAFCRPTLCVLGGPYADVTAHDLLWGYSSPYQSIGPVTPAEQRVGWPDPARVVSVLLAMLNRH